MVPAEVTARSGPVHRGRAVATVDPWVGGEFRAAAVVAAVMARWQRWSRGRHHLPLRDPDGASLPTWFRLPVIVASAVALDIAARWVLLVRRGGTAARVALRTVLVERWNRDQILFTASGLVTWYVAYVAFRNLKSYVPFVTDRLADSQLARIDRVLWLGHDPAVVLHHTLGTSWANWVMAGVYLVWIGLVPASLAIALVWTRRSPAGAWYVTAISLDWCLGAALYYIVPSLGPVYSSPEWFASLPHTPNTSVSEMLLADRIEVLAGPWDTGAVQTIAAFASLHVAVMFTICLMAEQMRLPAAIRVRRGCSSRSPAWRRSTWGGTSSWTCSPASSSAPRPSCWRPRPPATRCAVAMNRGRSAPRPTCRTRSRPSRPTRLSHRPHPSMSATLSRSAYAAASPSPYLVRGQKKPRSPSPLVRGTTWRWRCGTDWLTVLLIATNDPCAPRRVLDRRREPLGRREEPVALPRGEVRERLEVGARHEQDVPLEDRPGVEERHQVVGLQHEVTGHLAGDDLAEHASVHVTDGATGSPATRAPPRSRCGVVACAWGTRCSREPPTGLRLVPRGGGSRARL